jgi:hypothetical protein
MPIEREKDPKRITASQWMKRINRSLKFRDQVRDDQNWKRIHDEYKGKYIINSGGQKAPPINLVYGYVETAIPRIYFRDPHMSVNPKGGQSVLGAKILEMSVGYIFRELNLKLQVLRLLKDAFLVGHGWLKYGYIGTMGQTESEVPDEASEYIKDEEIFVAYVPYEDVVFDVSMSQDAPHDCRWLAHRVVRPLADVKADTKYSNTGRLRANVTVRDARGEKVDDSLKDADSDMFEFWEVHDKDTNAIYVVCDQTDKYLCEKPNTYEMKGFQFSMLKFNSVPGEPYPLSDIYIIEAQILERVKLRGAQINHIKRWSRQLSVEEGAMTKEEMEKFAQGVDGTVTQRKRGSQPPAPIQYADIQKESFQIDNLIQQDIDAVIGQNETERGGTAKTDTNTKFELQSQQAGTSVRQSSRQDVLEDFLEEVTMKVISLIKQFQTTPRYVRITGMQPEQIAEAFPGLQMDETGIYFTNENIQGEYDCEAKAGSTLPLNRENKVKLIESSLNPAVAQVLGIVPGSPTAFALGKALFRELDMKDVSDAYDQQIQQMTAAAAAAPPPGAGNPGTDPNAPLLPEAPMGGPAAPAQGAEPVSHVVHHQAPPGTIQ